MMNGSVESLTHLTCDLVRFPSISSENNEKISQYVADYLSVLGFQIEWLTYLDEDQKVKVSIVAKRGDGIGGVGYFAHTDVVPADDWSVTFCGPFEPKISEGRLYGRGACDMKGSLAAALMAARSIVEENAIAHPMYFVVTSDEEVGMLGARMVREKSELFAEMIEGGCTGIIGEPTCLQVVHAHKGALGFHIVSNGVSAHTSTRGGVNANYRLIPALLQLLEIRQKAEQSPIFQNAQFDPPTLSWNITLKNEPEAVNITPSVAYANNFLRTMPDVDIQPLLKFVNDLCREHGLEFRQRDGVDPWGVPADSSWIRKMLAITETASPQSVCYATDAGVLQSLERLLVCGPGGIEQAHRSDEWISLDQLTRGYSVYRRAFRDLA